MSPLKNLIYATFGAAILLLPMLLSAQTTPSERVLTLEEYDSAQWFGDTLIAVRPGGDLEFYNDDFERFLTIRSSDYLTGDLEFFFDVEVIEDLQRPREEWLFKVSVQVTSGEEYQMIVDAEGNALATVDEDSGGVAVRTLKGGRQVLLISRGDPQTGLGVYDVYDVNEPETLLRTVTPFFKDGDLVIPEQPFHWLGIGRGYLIQDRDAATGDILLYDSDLKATDGLYRRLSAPGQTPHRLLPISSIGADTLLDMYRVEAPGADARLVVFDEAGTVWYDEGFGADGEVFAVSFEDYTETNADALVRFEVSSGADFGGFDAGCNFYRARDFSIIEDLSVFDPNFDPPSVRRVFERPGELPDVLLFLEPNKGGYVARDAETLTEVARFLAQPSFDDDSYFLYPSQVVFPSSDEGIAAAYQYDGPTEGRYGELIFTLFDGDAIGSAEVAGSENGYVGIDDSRVINGQLHLSVNACIQDDDDRNLSCKYEIVRIGGTTSTAEPELVGARIGPNPSADGRLAIEVESSESYNVAAVDALGRRHVLGTQLSGPASVTLPDAPGVYFVTVLAEGGARAHQVVVRR